MPTRRSIEAIVLRYLARPPEAELRSVASLNDGCCLYCGFPVTKAVLRKRVHGLIEELTKYVEARP